MYDRMESLIAESGKTKVSLCEKLSKCPTYLRDAKKQNTDIKGETLIILARELNTSPEYLTGKTDEKKPAAPEGNGLSTEAMELVRLFDLASPDLQAAALAVLKSAESHRSTQDDESANL